MAEIAFTQDAETITGSAGDDVITAFAPGAAPATIAAVRVADGLTGPVAAIAAPDESGRLFIVEREGLVKVLDLATGTIAATPALDLIGQLPTEGEQGLLGLSFHPDFAANGRFFVFLSQLDGTSAIREYSLGDDGVAIDGSERTIIEIPQPDYTRHKGGWIAFGPDGMLYAAPGDGNGSADVSDAAQNLDTLLGKVLRIDVDGDDFAADPLRNYAIPADNPFVDGAGLDEIWAYGLRNAWRNGFDSATGQLFIADVGQGTREEINLGAPGANYGWPLFEGDVPYAPPDASSEGLTAPIHVYTHASGDGRAVTGGTVYRGPSEALHGAYIFSDSSSAKIFALQDIDGDGTWTRTEVTDLAVPDVGSIEDVVSIDEGPDGALYLVDFGGEIFRLDPELSGPEDGADLVFGDAGRDRIYGGGGADTLLGGSDADTLFGMDGDDRLEGGEGLDMLRGGTGDDLYLVDRGEDRVIESADAGTDIVIATGMEGYTLTANTEVLVLTGDARFGAGNAENNTIYGSTLADSLFGQAGDDWVQGNAGDDSMWGGAGRDIFVFHTGDGADIIADFNVTEDAFAIVGEAVAVATTDAGMLITYGATDSVLLFGVASLPSGALDLGGISIGGDLSSASPWV